MPLATSVLQERATRRAVSSFWAAFLIGGKATLIILALAGGLTAARAITFPRREPR